MGLVLIQQRQNHNRDAQLTLAAITNDLNQLQGFPWEVENPLYGSPAQIRAQMRATERGIETQLDSLLRSSPPAPLKDSSAALEANFAALEPIFALGIRPGGWNAAGPTETAAQAQNVTLATALRQLGQARDVFAHRVLVGEWESRVGVVGTVVLLVAAFLFYYRRSESVRARLRMQAATDALTGLANRAAFTDGLAARIGAPSAPPAAVLFVDLDDFKDVNDALGHRGGDEVLRQVAERLRGNTRACDLCARLGGDEFAVVLHDADAASAERFADRIAAALAEPFSLGHRSVRIEASVGIAVAPRGIDLETLIHWADVAMYAAKANRNGRIELFEPRLLAGEASRAVFERQLEEAVATGQFVVYYQPVVSLVEGCCCGAEALVCWNHPERGLLQPAEFVPTAERTGAIVDVGTFVLRQACRDAVAWEEAAGGRPLAVHVNVSGRQLAEDDFVEIVAEALRESSLPAERLVLEVTEGVLLHSAGASDRLSLLREQGVGIAIDDFGTGYASLATLRSLPIGTVKIDRSVVARAPESDADRAVVAAILRMASGLGLRTIAEGVERPDQARLLEAMGVDGLQGFLYLRPTTSEELIEWLRERSRTHPRRRPRGHAAVVEVARSGRAAGR